MTLRLSARMVAAVLFGAAAVVVLLSLPAPFFRYILGFDLDTGFPRFAERMFDLSGEANVPAWFSSGILLISSLLLAGIASAERELGRLSSRYWYGVAAIFLLLSLDEAAALHEKVGAVMENFLTTSGALLFQWVIPAILLVLAVGLLYLRFLLALPARTRNLFVLAGIIFVGGAVGMEMVDGYYLDTAPGQATSGFRVLLMLVEEAMEMVGVILFIFALLDYAGRRFGAVELVLDSEAPARRPLAARSEPATCCRTGRSDDPELHLGVHSKEEPMTELVGRGIYSVDQAARLLHEPAVRVRRLAFGYRRTRRGEAVAYPPLIQN